MSASLLRTYLPAAFTAETTVNKKKVLKLKYIIIIIVVVTYTVFLMAQYLKQGKALHVLVIQYLLCFDLSLFSYRILKIKILSAPS
jgi:uncharacterized membrane protein